MHIKRLKFREYYVNPFIECWKNSFIVSEILGEEVARHYLHIAETEQRAIY